LSGVEIRVGPAGDLAGYASIPARFSTDTIFSVSAEGPPFELIGQLLDAPLHKNYDELESPHEWPALFDVSRWAVMTASIDNARVGHALLARDTPGVDMLENRHDLLVVWDIRVHPRAQGMGVGRRLFRAIEDWGNAHGCIELKIETQNVNHAACRFYEAMGCVLASANRGAYPDLPDEVQLIWRKMLAPARD
jgi:GNAT superfamily N-acetyltransferase